MLDDLVATIMSKLNDGIGNLTTPLLYIATTLGIIDLTLSILYEWQEQNLSRVINTLIKKGLKYSFTFVLINNVVYFSNMLIGIATNIGYLFFPNEYKGDQLPKFSDIYETLTVSLKQFLKNVYASDNISFSAKVIFLLLSIFLFWAIYQILVELIVSFLTYNLTVVVGMFLLAFNTLQFTASLAQSYLQGLLRVFVRVMVAFSTAGLVFSTLQTIGHVSEDVTLFGAIEYVVFVALLAKLVQGADGLAGLIVSGSGDFGGGSLMISGAMGAVASVALTAVSGGAGLAAKGVSAGAGAVNALKAATQAGVKGMAQGGVKGAMQSVTEAFKSGGEARQAFTSARDSVQNSKITQGVTKGIKNAAYYGLKMKELSQSNISEIVVKRLDEYIKKR